MNLDLTADQIATVLRALQVCAEEMRDLQEDSMNACLCQYYGREREIYEACYKAVYDAI